jgi:secreted Zn-dependent insulinase-like peptidase
MLKKVLVLSVIFLLVSSTCFAFEVNMEQIGGILDKIIPFFNEQIVPLWDKTVAWAESNLSEQTLNEIKKEVGEAMQEIPVVAKAIWDKVVELLN